MKCEIYILFLLQLTGYINEVCAPDDHFCLTNIGKDATALSCVMLLHHLNIVQEKMVLPSNSNSNPEASSICALF